MTAPNGESALTLTMTDAMDLVRYAVAQEAAATRDGTLVAVQAHTALVRNLARRIQNEVTSGVAGKYTAADVALLRELAIKHGAGGSAERMAAALAARMPAAG